MNTQAGSAHVAQVQRTKSTANGMLIMISMGSTGTWITPSTITMGSCGKKVTRINADSSGTWPCTQQGEWLQPRRKPVQHSVQYFASQVSRVSQPNPKVLQARKHEKQARGYNHPLQLRLVRVQLSTITHVSQHGTRSHFGSELTLYTHTMPPNST